MNLLRPATGAAIRDRQEGGQEEITERRPQAIDQVEREGARATTVATTRRIERTLGPRFSRRAEEQLAHRRALRRLGWASRAHLGGRGGGDRQRRRLRHRLWMLIRGPDGPPPPGVAPGPAAAPPSDRPEFAPMSDPVTPTLGQPQPAPRAPSRSPAARSPYCCSTRPRCCCSRTSFTGFIARRPGRRAQRCSARRPHQRARLAHPGAG